MLPDSPPPRAEFRRRLDGLVYAYTLVGPRHGHLAWKRDDLDLWVQWSAALGWVGCDAAGTVTARPWDVPISEQGDLPPTGIWVSRKEDKAYVYEFALL